MKNKINPFDPICLTCGEEITGRHATTQMCSKCREIFDKERARLMKLVTKRAKFNTYRIRKNNSQHRG